MRKVFRSGALALIGLAATVAPVLTAATSSPAAGAATKANTATAGAAKSGAATPHITPGLYHLPIVGKVTLPGLGSSLGGVRHATAVQSSNWSGYADIDDTFNSVVASWVEPKATCSSTSGGLSGLLGGPSTAGAFWVGLDGYNSTSVEQLGTDSDCDGATPTYYAWYEMYPNPSVTLPNTVKPGDSLTAYTSYAGSQFTLNIQDSTQGWTFSQPETCSFSRSSAEVIAEAPEECTTLFCSEVPLTNFGQVNFTGTKVANASGTSGGLSAFDAQEITMADSTTGTVEAQPSALSSDGSAFSVTYKSSGGGGLSGLTLDGLGLGL
jgi:hypothetical protein